MFLITTLMNLEWITFSSTSTQSPLIYIHYFWVPLSFYLSLWVSPPCVWAVFSPQLMNSSGSVALLWRIWAVWVTWPCWWVTTKGIWCSCYMIIRCLWVSVWVCCIPRWRSRFTVGVWAGWCRVVCGVGRFSVVEGPGLSWVRRCAVVCLIIILRVFLSCPLNDKPPLGSVVRAAFRVPSWTGTFLITFVRGISFSGCTR